MLTRSTRFASSVARAAAGALPVEQRLPTTNSEFSLCKSANRFGDCARRVDHGRTRQARWQRLDALAGKSGLAILRMKRPPGWAYSTPIPFSPYPDDPQVSNAIKWLCCSLHLDRPMLTTFIKGQVEGAEWPVRQRLVRSSPTGKSSTS
jgi:hypothetical protein